MAVEVLVQGLLEDEAFRGGAGKQGYRGSELEVVGRAEDLMDCASLNLNNQFCALEQARAEDGVARVGLGFLERADAELIGHLAMAETLHLREDEPDPVAALVAGAEFGQDFSQDPVLGADEAVEMEGVFDGDLLLQYPDSVCRPDQMLQQAGAAGEAAGDEPGEQGGS